MTRWCVLVWFTFPCCLVAGQTTKYGLLGQRVIFSTDIKIPPDDILWMHNKNKAVEFNGNEEIPYGSFKDRVSLDWHSADLTISNLRYEDSGHYELETFTNNKMSSKIYILEVIDKVAKPNIYCKKNTSYLHGEKATLTCSSPSRDPLSLLAFQWSSNTTRHSGPELMISLGGEHDDQMYNCTVSNPLTQESATFSAKACYHDNKNQAILIARIVVTILLLIIALMVYIVFVRRHQEDTMG